MKYFTAKNFMKFYITTSELTLWVLSLEKKIEVIAWFWLKLRVK